MTDDDPDKVIRRLERRVERERLAREEAEGIAERGLRDLWEANRDLEKRVSERTADLEQSLRATQMAAEAKERFLAELGHELNTPLHAVLGLLELIDTTQLEPVDRERVSDVREHAGQLSGLLKGLVDLASSEGESSPEDIVAETPSIWLDQLVSAWTRRAALSGQLLVPSVAGPDTSVDLDWGRLRRIVDPILDNATVHGDAGAVTIEIESNSDLIRLVVADGGPGMSVEQLATALDPFRSAGPNAGVGVGLALADRLASAAGGAVHLDSDGHGTRVTVVLPIATTTAPTSSATAPVSSETTIPDRELVQLSDGSAG